MNIEDYSRLEDALLVEALGSDKPEVDAQQVTRTRKGADGSSEVQVQTNRVRRPDIALINKLLSERIGGPQDFC